VLLPFRDPVLRPPRPPNPYTLFIYIYIGGVSGVSGVSEILGILDDVGSARSQALNSGLSPCPHTTTT